MTTIATVPRGFSRETLHVASIETHRVGCATWSTRHVCDRERDRGALARVERMLDRETRFGRATHRIVQEISAMGIDTEPHPDVEIEIVLRSDVHDADVIHRRIERLKSHGIEIIRIGP